MVGFKHTSTELSLDEVCELSLTGFSERTVKLFESSLLCVFMYVCVWGVRGYWGLHGY